MSSKSGARLLEKILIAVIIIFSALSAYTTKDGFALVWGEDHFVVRELLAWGIAVGTSLFMIYLSVQVVKFAAQGKFFRLIFGYLFVASLSMFFNFNAIYGRQAKSFAFTEEALRLRESLMNLKAGSIAELEKTYKIYELQRAIDSLSAEMEIERTHNLRPGLGTIHQKLKQEKAIKESALASASKEVVPIKENIESVMRISLNRLDEAIKSGDEKLLSSALDDGKKSFDDVYAEIKAKISSYIVDKPILEAYKIDRPDYSLFTVINLFEKDKINDEERARINLSIFISVALDFPIFFSLAVLNWPIKRDEKSKRFWKRKNRTPKDDADIWG